MIRTTMAHSKRKGAGGRAGAPVRAAAVTAAALLVLALVPACSGASGASEGDGATDARQADVQAQQAQPASAQPADGTMEVSFLVPVYNEDGNPKSGVREWKTETRVCTVVNSSQTGLVDDNATDGWYVATGDVSLDWSLTCYGKVSLVLADGCSLTVHGRGGYAGIGVVGKASLAIYSQSNGSDKGHLLAMGGSAGAGIGSSTSMNIGCITVCGGDVTGIGKDGAAGIGSGGSGDVRGITIVGGNVGGKGGDRGAGIGGGWNGKGVGIAVSGGTVTATGGAVGGAMGGGSGAGIGGGAGRDSEDVAIAAELVACCGADGESWTALTPEEKAGDASGILGAARYAATGTLAVGEQQGSPAQGEPGSAAYAVSASNPAIGSQAAVTAVTWALPAPQGADWSCADGLLTISTSAETAAGSYAFLIEAGGATSGAALTVSGPAAHGAAHPDAPEAPQASPSPQSSPLPADPQASPSPSAPADPQADPEPAVLGFWGWLQRLLGGAA